MRPPATWIAKVEKKLPNPKAFWAAAAAFEAIALVARRHGFEAHAKHVLPGPEHGFPAVWRQDRALKEALVAMTDGHCAYCQVSVTDGHAGAVEHWKPKSLFPTLAYDWANYFFSCERCNTSKSNKWPEHGAYARPDEGEPAARFVFTQRGRVRGAPGDADARRTVRDFRLNRPELCKRRARAIKKSLQALRWALEEPGLTERQRHELAKMQIVERLGAFSEAINQNVRRVWGRAYPGLPV
jgi:uncharacterized protein (TIGR02646 family)